MKNNLYQCPYCKAVKCDMKESCLGCPQYRNSDEIIFSCVYRKRNILKEFYYSRWGKYLIYLLTYVIFYKTIGFELTVISALSILIAENHYQNDIK